MSLINIKAKIKMYDAAANVRRMMLPKSAHVSGYTAGYSKDTDVIPFLNDNGRIIGSELRATCERVGLLHPTIHVIIFDGPQKMLIQRRSAHMSSSAGKLAQSVGGHISMNECTAGRVDFDRAIQREVFEELGIQLEKHRLINVYKYNSVNSDNNEIAFLYIGIYSGRVHPNPTEVAWAEYFDPIQVKALSVENPSLFSNSFLQDIYYMDKLRVF